MPKEKRLHKDLATHQQRNKNHPKKKKKLLKKQKKKAKHSSDDSNDVLNISQTQWQQILLQSTSADEKELSVLLDDNPDSIELLRNTALNSFPIPIEEDVLSDPDLPRETPSEKQVQIRIKQLKEREMSQIQFSNMQRIMQELLEKRVSKAPSGTAGGGGGAFDLLAALGEDGEDDEDDEDFQAEEGEDDDEEEGEENSETMNGTQEDDHSDNAEEDATNNKEENSEEAVESKTDHSKSKSGAIHVMRPANANKPGNL